MRHHLLEPLLPPDISKMNLGLEVSSKKAAEGAPEGESASKVGRMKGKGKSKSSQQEREEDSDNTSNKALVRIITLIGKLSLGTARETAMIKSAILQVCLFDKQPTNKALPKLEEAAKAATAAYAAKAKTLSQPEKATFGSPHIFAWAEFCKSTLMAAQMLKLAQPAATIEAHILDIETKAAKLVADTNGKMELAAAAREETQNQVKVFRIQKCWNKELARLEMNTTYGTTAEKAGDAILTVLKSAYGGVMKKSQAPKSDLERRLQAWIDTKGKNDKMEEEDWS